MDIYQQAVSDERRLAQNLAFEGLMGLKALSTLQHPKSEEKEAVMLPSS